MTNKLIFINLLIDSLWSENRFLEKIFDVKSPNVNNLARINEYLGQFFANDGDYIICPAKPAQKIEKLQSAYLNLSKVNWVYAHSLLPHVEDFVTEVVAQCPGNTVSDFIFAGKSQLEARLSNELNIPISATKSEIELIKKFNRKDYLLDLSNILDIKIPESEVVKAAEISSSDHLFKSLASSGGSGVYNYTDLERIRQWADRKNLTAEWNSSSWLKQVNLEREQDFNCFGTTESDRFQVVKVKYDKNRLSYQHDFDFEMDSKVSDKLKTSFFKVKNHLVEQGYLGPFGFDSVVTKQKEVFTIIDLNVRLNKSHVLRQIMQKFKVRKLYTSFYRLRFVNSQWTNFEDFWKYLLESTNINSEMDSFLFPVDASYWTEGKSECLVALSTDNRILKERIDQWFFRFLINLGGQPND